MVPYIKVKDNMELSEFIKAHVEEINKNDFTKVYEDAYTLLDAWTTDSSSICKLTEIFLDAGISPLSYMKTVPNRYLTASKITSVEIPNNITSIGDLAFSDCKRLESIIIPNSVTKIGKWALSGCVSLTSIELPDNLLKIGDSAFFACKGLTSVTIPDKVTMIDSWAFCNCENLTSITIPSSLKDLGGCIFGRCDKLRDILFKGTVEQWEAISKSSAWNAAMTNYTIHCTDGDLEA